MLFHLEDFAEPEKDDQEILAIEQSKVEDGVHGHENEVHHRHRRYYLSCLQLGALRPVDDKND